jgi:hypothetical protein
MTMKGWEHDSNGSVPASQMQGPEFKSHYHQKHTKHDHDNLHVQVLMAGKTKASFKQCLPMPHHLHG